MNIPDHILSKVDENLHNKKKHPIETVKKIIYDCFPDFSRFDDISPKVAVRSNFDDLLIPKNHVSRSLSDTYYVSDDVVLRTHTSAHQTEMLKNGEYSFLVAGDCYRRDEIDSCHYPVFHQIEGVRVVESVVDIESDLKSNIELVIGSLFGDCQFRMRSHKFPFTQPSWEVDVFYNGNWLEVLGCGIVHYKIMKSCGLEGSSAWAFGMGLDRLAMILFDIPDIRLMWSSDERFIGQFDGSIKKFKPFSKYPPCNKDISMWLGDSFCENSMNDIIRGMSGDLVESVSLQDTFTKDGKTSNCYRVVYRSMDRSFTNEEVNNMHISCVELIKSKIDCVVRE